ncbi:MAG TPA: beta-N-acetylhexosaminidase, partial [Gammaproteobacteria bacterium]|nr:beta-N-acetylhexosaminidase [Gammaproteobacteria bacterium]
MSLGPVMLGISGESLTSDEREWLIHPAVGGVILFSRNFSGREQLCALVESIRAARSPGLLIAVDQEGGRVQRFMEPFTVLPPMRELGLLAATDRARAAEVAEKTGWLMAAELRACGIDMSFAPVVDLDLGMAAVIGDRAFHSEASDVATLTLAFVRGMRRAGMAATAKHFPTHAGATADSHQCLAVDRRDYSQLYDDLIPYRRLIEAGLLAVMVGHVVFPELDERPASLSRWWIVDQLRGELRFTGAVISDDLGMGGVDSQGPLPDRMHAALSAGCDMALVCNDLEVVPEILERLREYNDPAAQLRLM